MSRARVSRLPIAVDGGMQRRLGAESAMLPVADNRPRLRHFCPSSSTCAHAYRRGNDLVRVVPILRWPTVPRAACSDASVGITIPPHPQCVWAASRKYPPADSSAERVSLVSRWSITMPTRSSDSTNISIRRTSRFAYGSRTITCRVRQFMSLGSNLHRHLCLYLSAKLTLIARVANVCVYAIDEDIEPEANHKYYP